MSGDDNSSGLDVTVLMSDVDGDGIDVLGEGAVKTGMVYSPYVPMYITSAFRTRKCKAMRVAKWASISLLIGVAVAFPWLLRIWLDDRAVCRVLSIASSAMWLLGLCGGVYVLFRTVTAKDKQR